MCANHAGNCKVIKVNVTDVGATSRSISPTARYTPRLSETKTELGLPQEVRQQIRTHWCKCGNWNNGNEDGLCPKCREVLRREYEARGS